MACLVSVMASSSSGETFLSLGSSVLVDVDWEDDEAVIKMSPAPPGSPEGVRYISGCEVGVFLLSGSYPSPSSPPLLTRVFWCRSPCSPL